jgi:phenylalanyl-tRNA synthetase beta chain
VEASVRAAAGGLLRGVALFDEFRGRGVPAGSRSLAFRLTFGADDRTLRGAEVEAAVASVVAALESKTGGRLRRS